MEELLQKTGIGVKLGVDPVHVHVCVCTYLEQADRESGGLQVVTSWIVSELPADGNV